jgi:hypothetical protein
MARVELSLAALAVLLVAAPGPAPSCPAATTAEATRECCKVCRKGKACGNGCIKANARCSKGPGCACDASETS